MPIFEPTKWWYIQILTIIIIIVIIYILTNRTLTSLIHAIYKYTSNLSNVMTEIERFFFLKLFKMSMSGIEPGLLWSWYTTLSRRLWDDWKTWDVIWSFICSHFFHSWFDFLPLEGNVAVGGMACFWRCMFEFSTWAYFFKGFYARIKKKNIYFWFASKFIYSTPKIGT